MRPFEHVSVGSIDQALQALSLSDDWSVRILAGGTDLMHEMKQGIAAPQRLVDIKAIPGLDRIEESEGVVSIGALVRVSELERDDLVGSRLPMLAQAAGEVASPQLRNMGTVAGNVLQRPRCWYYRDRDTVCLRRGGDRCFAVAGDNRLHAIFGGGPCHIVCPSDLAPALVALRAVVDVAGSRGTRRLPLADLFRTPKEDPLRENALAPTDIVTGFHVRVPGGVSRGVFLKARERQVWDFALASVAAQVRLDADGRVNAADIVLGGVAPNPWVSKEAAEAVTGERLTDEVCRRAAEAAMKTAHPLRHNAYKVELTRSLIERALSSLRG